MNCFCEMKKYVVFIWMSCVLLTGNAQKPIDKSATKQTKALLVNLHALAGKGFMFGHQDTRAYGVGWRAEEGRSDVLETVGTFAAVSGWDVGTRLDTTHNIDSVEFSKMKQWMLETYRGGGINTVSWHLDNLLTGGNSWDQTPAVSSILPGGSHHSLLLNQLDLLADFFKTLKDGKTPIPVVFRPWHEHNGNWFWWGKGNCTEEEYRALFQFTVNYLRHEKGVHNLLYAFSPDRSRLIMNERARESYLYGYPGDEYVDILGIDNYSDVGRKGDPGTDAQKKANFIGSLQLITALAKEKRKVAALTETGLESLFNHRWFTEIILNPIKAYDQSIDLAWVLVWRNANTVHHYAPYPGHPSETDFRTFEADVFTFFQKDLHNPYKKRRILKK